MSSIGPFRPARVSTWVFQRDAEPETAVLLQNKFSGYINGLRPDAARALADSLHDAVDEIESRTR